MLIPYKICMQLSKFYAQSVKSSNESRGLIVGGWYKFVNIREYVLNGPSKRWEMLNIFCHCRNHCQSVSVSWISNYFESFLNQFYDVFLELILAKVKFTLDSVAVFMLTQ